MALDCKLLVCYMICLLTVSVAALDLSELELDSSLNPKLLGAVYNLYSPNTPTKATPITIDCNHPSVICRFGTSALVTTNKECNCKETSAEVPIIAGLTTADNNVTKIIEKGGSAAVTNGNENSKVPIYSGVIDTNAVLNEPDRPYNIWNFQRNSIDKGWRPSQDPSKTRVGELPTKFTSYYPFAPPRLPSMSDEFPDFPPELPDVPPHYILWRKPVIQDNPKFTRPTTPNNARNPTSKPTVKVTTNKILTTSQKPQVTPKK